MPFDDVTIGIMQGRLSDKPGQPIQSFPWDSWREEFNRAYKVGFDSIEWLVDCYGSKNNPIYTDKGRSDIKNMIDKYDVAVHSICAHTFIDGALLCDNKYALLAADYFCRLLDSSAEIDMRYVIIPAMGNMSIQTLEAQDKLCKILPRILKNTDLVVLMESDLAAVDLAAFINRVGFPNLAVLYDLGNANAMGFNIEDELKVLGALVKEVHMKDRVNNNGNSCRLGYGNTPFNQATKGLEKSSWNGNVVLETPIFDNWKIEAELNYDFTRNWCDRMLYDHRMIEILYKKQ